MKLQFILAALCVLYVQGKADRPCVPLEFEKGDIVCVCNMTYCDTISKVTQVPADRYVQYSTSQSGLRFHMTEGLMSDIPHSRGIVFKLNLRATYQVVRGFGGAITDAAGLNIHSLSTRTKENLMSSSFSTDGIEFNFGRVPIAGCDFSTHTYMYDDVPGDTNFTHINLTLEDFFYKIPLIKEAQKLSQRGLHLVAAAWTAPPWMKTNGDNPWDFEKVKLGSWSRGESYIEDILQNLNHWLTGWTEWNLALNPQGGPNWAKNVVDAAIIVNTTANEFYKQPTIYVLGHFVKFLPEGSKCIRVEPKKKNGVSAVAFQTPDSAVVIILYNRSDSDATVTIKTSKARYINLIILKHSIHTILTGKSK